jgi:hypothetical protein
MLVCSASGNKIGDFYLSWSFFFGSSGTKPTNYNSEPVVNTDSHYEISFYELSLGT